MSKQHNLVTEIEADLRNRPFFDRNTDDNYIRWIAQCAAEVAQKIIIDDAAKVAEDIGQIYRDGAGDRRSRADVCNLIATRIRNLAK